MVLEGEPLAKLLHHVFALGFTTSDSLRRIRFENPFPIEPTLSRPAIPFEYGRGDGGVTASQANGDAQA
jgi:hypothetical protein